MRALCRLGGAGLALIGATAAQAADLPVKAPPMVAPAPFNWTGFYVGANVGGVWDRSRIGGTSFTLEPVVVSDPAGAATGVPVGILIIPATIPLPVTFGRNSKGASLVGGGQAGSNWQTGAIVYGLEAGLQGMNSSATHTGTLSQFFPGVTAAGNITRSLTANINVEREWEASFRARLGYTWDRLMLFGTGGVSISSVEARTTFTATTTLGPALGTIAGFPNPNGTTTNADRHTLFGPTAGVGLEYALTNAVIAGAEYRYTHYDQKSINLGTTPAGPIPSTPPGPASLRLDSHQVTARLSYLFGR
jgi:outer membrane immunogenic protein